MRTEYETDDWEEDTADKQIADDLEVNIRD